VQSEKKGARSASEGCSWGNWSFFCGFGVFVFGSWLGWFDFRVFLVCGFGGDFWEEDIFVCNEVFSVKKEGVARLEEEGSACK